MTDVEQSKLPSGEASSASEDTKVQNVSDDDQRLAEYRAAEKRDGRILRLFHASAVVFITCISAFLAMKGAAGAALRFFGGGLLVYLIVWIVFGLILQWRRELGVNET